MSSSSPPVVVRPEQRFSRLVDEHGRAVQRLCRSILRDEHLGADAAQETFLRLWRHLVRERALPDDAQGCGRWLRRVALSVSLDLLRRRAVRRSADVPDELPARGPAPDARVLEDELDAALERALARLPEGQRTVFLLRHAGGLGLAEAAELLGVEPSTVKTQFARACVKLQGALEPFLPDDER